MENVEPKIVYARGDGTFFEPSSNSFNNRYGRANEEQKKKYDITLDKISKDFEANWPNMNDKEKMQWKFQRYMQDYLATISSINVLILFKEINASSGLPKRDADSVKSILYQA